MKIAGLQKLSLVDYDGHMATTIFVSGCNFACPFCHNSGLVNNTEEEIREWEVLEHLEKRKGLLDSVCISGGEPTIYNDLPTFISRVKAMGYLVKLDTNGTNLDMVKYLVENKLIDYIAMDIKNSLNKYSLSINKDIDPSIIHNTITYIMNCGIDYEFRTTLVEELHDREDIESIAKLINGAKRYYLQKFEDCGHCLTPNLHKVEKNIAEEYLGYLIDFIPNTRLRGY